VADRSYTTIRAWPWPGEDQLPQTVRDALTAHEFEGLDADGVLAPDADRDPCASRAVLVSGDESSGVILTITGLEANGGIEAYRDLIDALHDAGLNIYAQNSAGDEYDGEWEYRPSGGEPTARTISGGGDTVISAEELLAHCQTANPDAKDLTGIGDATVGAAAKLLLADPQLPRAVIAAL
jgi:hypothetical protein